MSIHLSCPSDLVGVIQQDSMNADDLYTPKYTRFSGAQKEGYCDLCSPGKWLKMKNSTFWYHKQFFHGISHKTCTWFDSPSETRMNKDVPEGKCHKCLEWVPLLKQKRKNGNINWFHHAASCHFRDDKRKRYDTEDLLNELKRRKDELSDDEFDLASLQPTSYTQSPTNFSFPQTSQPLKSPTSGNSISPPQPEMRKKSPQLPVLKPDAVRPRPPIANIDVSSAPFIGSHGSANSTQSPVNVNQLSPQDRANHENLLQLQLHHMQQIQQIQMMLYSPNPQAASPMQLSPQYGVVAMEAPNQPHSSTASRPVLPQRVQEFQQRGKSNSPPLPNLPPLQNRPEIGSPHPSADDVLFE